MDESIWLLLSNAALVMVSTYAIWLRLNLWAYNRPRPGPFGGRPMMNSNRTQDNHGSGCVMFFVLLSLIMYGVWFIMNLFSA